MMSKNEISLYHYLNKINESNISEIRILIPNLYEDGSDNIKQELIEFIGDHELIEYLDLVKSEIKTPTSDNLSSSAMVSLYDLIGNEALEFIKCNSKLDYAKEVLTLKCLELIVNISQESLDEIMSIVLLPNCDYRLQYNVLNILRRYLDIHSYDGLIELFKSIMKISKPESGIYRDIE